MAVRRLRLGLLYIVVCLTLLQVPGPVRVSAFPPPEPSSDTVVGQTVPQNDRFGLCFVSAVEAPADAARYSKAVAAGAGWTRVPIYWGNVERSTGVMDWSAVDRVAADDQANGLTTNAILLGTPSQYATAGQPGIALPQVGKRPVPLSGLGDQKTEVSPASSAPQNLYQPIFSDGTDIPSPGKAINPGNPWARFVYAAVARYAPQIRHWEIWNEPDYPFFWNSSVQDYYRLLKVAYIAAKFADPGSTVLLGGLAIYISPGWLESLFEVMKTDPARVQRDANGWYFDILPIHIYSNSYETYYQVRRVRTLLQKYGLGGKSIWINESGVPVWNDYPGPTWDPTSLYRATMEEQAAYVIQNFAYGFFAGADRIFHFQLYDDCGNSPGGTNDVGDAYGLYRNPSDAVCFRSHATPNTPRPSYKAYQLAATYLNGAIPLWRRNLQGDHEEIAYYLPSTRERVLFLWATRGSPVVTQVSAVGTQAMALDQDGSAQPLTPVGGAYTVMLPGATNRNLPDHITYMIGGRPLILVERDTTPPVVTVQPLPLYSPADIVLSWQGTDEGSGMASYDAFVSVDGGPMLLWLQGTQALSATFTGVSGHSYGFAVRGTDRAGNAGSMPHTAQTETVVTLPGGPTGTPAPTATPTPTPTATPLVTTIASGRILNPLGTPVAGGTVYITNAWGMPSAITADALGQWQVAGLPKGNYGLIAAQSGYGSWPSRHLQLDGAVSGFDVWLAPLVNLVHNGDFEAGLEGWNLGGSTPAQISTTSFDGLKSLVLGKDFIGQPELSGGGNSTLSQSITVPQTDSPVYLSLLYQIASLESDAGHDWFEVLLIDGPTRHEPLPPRTVWQSSQGWQHFVYDLSPWRGRTVLLILNVWQDSSQRPTLAFVDEVSVGSPPSPSPTVTPTPSSTATFTPSPTATRTPEPTMTPTATPTATPITYHVWIPKVFR
jgi:hypothetical protein